MKPNYWLYKCNRAHTDYARFTGNWFEVFEEPWTTVSWGNRRKIPELKLIRKGDLLICQQSDVPKKLLVGLARAVGFRNDYLRLRPIESIEVRIQPLKAADARIAAIKALQPGEIKTAYPMRRADAQRLLRAARAQLQDDAVRRPAAAKWGDGDKKKLKLAEKHLRELPAAERQVALREVRRVVRNALLRQMVLRHWPAKCAACGRGIEVLNETECEVAHIRDVHANGLDQLRNAIPLCRTHHWAFDAHLWSIRPKDRRIIVRKSFRGNEMLKMIHDRKIRAPRSRIPSVEFLGDAVINWRWHRFIEAAKGDL